MNSLLKKYYKDYKVISEHYRFLIDRVKKHESIEIINEWLIDNYYLLVECKNEISSNSNKLSKNLKSCKSIYKAILEIVNKNDYNITNKSFIKELNSYQRKNNIYFSYQELSLVKTLLIFCYNEKLCELSLKNIEEFKIRDQIKEMIDEVSEFKVENFISKKFNVSDNYYYIFELNNNISNMGDKSNSFFKDLNLYLEKENISLKNILNDVYQEKTTTTMLITNIFNNIKEIMTFDIEEIYINVNECEKLLSTDKIYAKMSVGTKESYRRKIIKNAKKMKLNEYKYVEDLASRNVDHIGFYLFKNKSKDFFMYIYIIVIILASLILSMLLSKYFINNRIIGFLIVFIPTSQLIIQIVNQILQVFIKPKSLPKMDFKGKIPDEYASMIVIPTIVSDTQKVKEVFDKLETYYLMNKSSNLYFTLLGDVAASSEEEMDYDDEISEYGIKCASTLNKKYRKEIFHFVYRKRIWNEKENCYLGYERKRGALLQLNRVLLHKNSKKEAKAWFNANTLSDFTQDIKYVITLDTDTEPVLNSIIDLIGCMAHPLNRPILNEEQTKVIQGYALMQPRINTDIESTNKSLYSQIFAGIGGFDTYSSVSPNVFQDVFQEGSFVGKGIYDLEVFDQILYQRFPDNLILSHDLLEGNYLRCGYVSDVELIDGFPSKFLVDTSRQHRWARGDAQIISYLLPKVKNYKGEYEKNPINVLGKWKIFDNISRMFLYPMLLLIILLGTSLTSYSWLWVFYSLLVVAFPILIFFKDKLYTKKSKNKIIYYKDIIFGGKSLLIRTLVVFSTIPYYTELYLDAFIRSMYRLLVSHKNLLNWVTAEESEKKSKFNISTYLYNFISNLVVGIVILILGIIYKNIFLMVIGLIFILAPFIVYIISKDITYDTKLNESYNDKLLSISLKTWKYFEENLCEKYNYLIPDNYQENREEKLDLRTSPTNIGFSITSVIAAYELEFISLEDCINYLDKIINVVNSLEKWNGHLYNWYNIETKEVLNPRFISTVDSGNFVASLIMALEFLKEKGSCELVSLCEKLIKNTNFKKLYTKKHVLSIGFDVSENHLSAYNYNKFASESRLTSFVAIAKGDVPIKHWFCLDKSLTVYNKNKGLISWSGTAFEYYMPFLFMKNYKNTLLDESYRFAYVCQKEYMESVDKNLPFGISESAYNELDNALNYKYHSFSVPYLKAREEKDDRIVISPYSTAMALELYPKEIFDNLLKFEKLNMLSKYGFYEAYDLSNHGIVRACFAHHQGMSLLGLTNYLKDDVMKKYFHQNVKVKTYEILLKEKVQLRAAIDMKMSKYKKYNYDKEKIENDIRAFKYISTMPEVSILSNKKYCVMMNDRGESFSRYRTLQLNRYRKITEQDYGIFFYIKDLDTKKIWSNTYAPIDIEPDNYEVVFASDRIKYLRKDGQITTTTEIIVTTDHNAEIRKLTFTNDSESDKNLQITSYTEPILSENPNDVSHRVFNSMFIESFYDKETDSLISKRNNRIGEHATYMMNRFIIDNPLEKYSYETDRFTFVGRGNTYQNPIAINNKLSNHAGSNIEPIMAIRNSINVPSNSKVSVYFVCGFGRSVGQLKDIISSYNTKKQLEKAFDVATISNIINTKVLNLTGRDMKLYNTMLNYLYQTTRISVSEKRKNLLSNNALAQNALWKFGVSGDRPIILVNIKDISNLSFVMDILKAFEYFKNKSIFVDIIIINSENKTSAELIKKEIEDALYHMYTLNSFYHTPGNVFVLDANDISKEEMSLLKIVPRLSFDVSEGESLEDEILKLQNENKINDYMIIKNQNNISNDNSLKLDFDNSYGGFSNDGKEYIIYNKNTPTPWSNVIANKNFGTIVTNNGCGYTYCYNSGEYKISSWTNEMVLNDKSEGFKINNEIFDPEECIHGFGYSILKSETSKMATSVTEFVAVDENVKIYMVNISNKTDKMQEIDLSFFINPTLGNFEEKTARHILSEFNEKDNYLRLRNVYSINYSDVNTFMSSSEKIISTVDDRILVKEIATKIKLEPGDSKNVVFTLGCNRSVDKNLMLIYKYSDVKNCIQEFRKVQEYWDELLGTIKVKTPDKSFNYMLNGWYLYQTISSRIMARAGFYQVSGAFGYRDQLQDAMNICIVNPEFSRMQIINNASHQFEKGDVLHWWHESGKFGLRSRYKDDYLWLVYATIHYLQLTDDYTILDEMIPYIEGEELTEHESERGITFDYSSHKDSLFNHCLLSINYSMNQLGSHGLPLMGGGDWNDGMNMVGIKGKGESVWLGFFLYSIVSSFIPIIEKYNKDLDCNKYFEFNEKLKSNLNSHGYDKDYYLRAYFDNGDKLGSFTNSECKIDLISQAFSIISGVALEKNYDNLIKQVENNLVDKDNRIIKLLTPAFKKSLNNPGYIKNYPEGIRENGGQYTHSTAWYIMALVKAGYNDLAYNYYQMINPINRSVSRESIETYKVEPYVIAADIYSNKDFKGRGGWTWYTGSSAWFYRVGLEEILGFNLRGNILEIKPVIPSEWKEFDIEYKYFDAIYNIKVKIGRKNEITINGTKKEKINLKEKGNYNIVVTIKRG